MKCGSKFVTPARGLTASLDLTSEGSPWVAAVDTMLGRTFHNLTMLPTGEVIATGGRLGEGMTPVNRPEIWDPDYSDGSGARGYWYGRFAADTLAPSPVARGEHSTAIVLPDGRVLAAGGCNEEEHPDPNRMEANLYCPPYLFSDAAATVPAVRPRLSGVQEFIAYGQEFDLASPDSIARAVLIRPGATTHAFNQDQRWVPLARTGGASPCLRFRAPASASNAPPGDYLLFVLSPQNVPSIAEWVRLGSTPSSDQVCDVLAPQVVSLQKTCTRGESADLRWLSPHEDGTAGGAVVSYELRYRPGQPMNTVDDFLDYGTLVTDEITGPAPPGPGVYDSVTVTGLVPNTPYYFRLMYKDDAGSYRNWTLSNQLTFITRYQVCGGSGLTAGGGSGGGGFSLRQAGAEGTSAAGGSWGAGNSLLTGVTDRTGSDTWRLPTGPLAVNGHPATRLIVSDAHSMSLARTRLLAVDHAPELEAFASGGSFLLGTTQPAASVTGPGGAELTALLTGAGETYPGQYGDTLRVQLAGPDTRPALLIESRGPNLVQPPDSSGILIQIPDAEGWRTLTRHVPREGFDRFVLDSTAQTLRLVFLGEHELGYVGQVSRAAATPTVSALSLAGATQSRLGSISPLTDSTGFDLQPADTLVLEFEDHPLEPGRARDWFLAVEGSTASLRSAGSARLAPVRESAPRRFALHQNQPNPFAGTATIGFDLPAASGVRLEVFDLHGRRVQTLARGRYPAGHHRVEWDGRAAGGERLEAGIYFYRLIAGPFRGERKFVLLP
ncbi:MAG: DUF1929 domain-containing protein [Candidatus Eisenbacteria bacterium]|nr:DUF1929 domain-containing protein [Candidatus Eisenbacteria bacterium]